MAACIPIQKAIQILADAKGFMWIDHGVLKTGIVPFQEEATVDFASERLLPTSAIAEDPSPAHVPIRDRLMRHGGRYLFAMNGEIVECASLKDLLKKGLLTIAKHDPGMLIELTKVRPRTKRIVAIKPEYLFEDPKLVKQFSEPLKEGWYYGTNNSASETKGWLMRACEVAQLRWGRDFEVSI